MFAVNNNGIIIFHPRLKTVVSIQTVDKPIINIIFRPHQISLIKKKWLLSNPCYPLLTFHAENVCLAIDRLLEICWRNSGFVLEKTFIRVLRMQSHVCY